MYFVHCTVCIHVLTDRATVGILELGIDGRKTSVFASLY